MALNFTKEMNWRDLKLVLHIGFHKTGTTFLQKSFFPLHNDILYLGRSWVDKRLGEFFFDFGFLNDFEFDEKSMQRRFSEILDDYIKEKSIDCSKKNVLLISHESLHSGSDYFGFCIKRQAYRIKAVFPKANIILGVRNQIKMIESHYTEYIIHGGKMKFDYFFRYSYNFNFGLKIKFKYNKVIKEYCRNFGEKKIYVLIFEEVFSDKLNFLDLCIFLDIHLPEKIGQIGINPRLGKISISIIRTANILLAKDFTEQYKNRLQNKQSISEDLRWILIGLLKKIHRFKWTHLLNNSSTYISLEEKSKIENYFSRSNKELSKLIGKDLKKFGYKY
ncbi:MAG: sulfotransferase [Bacteroidetes bacterium]|nr:sulfotransferase [Bacteroidota bacterium]